MFGKRSINNGYQHGGGDGYEEVPIATAIVAIDDSPLEVSPPPPTASAVATTTATATATATISQSPAPSPPTQPTPAMPPPISYQNVTIESVTIDGDDDYAEESTPFISTSPTGNHQEQLEGDIAPKYQDFGFFIAFWIHLAIVLYIGTYFSPLGYKGLANLDWPFVREQILKQGDDLTEDDMDKMGDFLDLVDDYLHVYPNRILYYSFIPCCLIAFFIAFVMTTMLIKPFSKLVVTSSMLGTVCFAVIPCIFLFLSSPSIGTLLLSALVIGGVTFYVRLAWKMIPFAAINLKVALEGISANCGTYFVAFIFCEMGFWWVLYWMYTSIGFMIYLGGFCDADSDNVTQAPQIPLDTPVKNNGDDMFGSEEQVEGECSYMPWTFIAFLISFYWTGTVIMNSVQVTVAGVMATWCYDKQEASTCCSSAVLSSLFRTLTYSFGSICFGSLLQAFITALRHIINDARNRRDQNGEYCCAGCGGICSCVLECIASILGEALEYFNQWAYVFCGVYGSSYLESGRDVMELFKTKGWTTIITDKMIGYVLGFITVTMGIITGFINLILERLVSAQFDNLQDGESYVFGNFPGWKVVCFIDGFLLGFIICRVMMNVVQGAVNTLIVCWADSPSKMQLNHPILTREMAEAWANVFPSSGIEAQQIQ